MAGISQEDKYNNLTTDALQCASLVLAIASRDKQDLAMFSFQSSVILRNETCGRCMGSLEPSSSVGNGSRRYARHIVTSQIHRYSKKKK
jgi:hypothetical protein